MGVHAGQLALKSDLRLVQEYRRSLLPCLEQARRPTLDHHVYRSSGLGVWVLISENWYNWSLPSCYSDFICRISFAQVLISLNCEIIPIQIKAYAVASGETNIL